MISTPVLQVLIGLGAAYAFLGPQTLGLVKRFFTRKPSTTGAPAQQSDIVGMLSALMSIRRQVGSDPKAVEAIDTIITPAILRSEDKANAA